LGYLLSSAEFPEKIRQQIDTYKGVRDANKRYNLEKRSMRCFTFPLSRFSESLCLRTKPHQPRAFTNLNSAKRELGAPSGFLHSFLWASGLKAPNVRIGSSRIYSVAFSVIQMT
jgi:hypothetical protein